MWNRKFNEFCIYLQIWSILFQESDDKVTTGNHAPRSPITTRRVTKTLTPTKSATDSPTSSPKLSPRTKVVSTKSDNSDSTSGSKTLAQGKWQKNLPKPIKDIAEHSRGGNYIALNGFNQLIIQNLYYLPVGRTPSPLGSSTPCSPTAPASSQNDTSTKGIDISKVYTQNHRRISEKNILIFDFLVHIRYMWGTRHVGVFRTRNLLSFLWSFHREHKLLAHDRI